jgi:ribonucleoside-diphosphate reductase beta chain
MIESNIFNLDKDYKQDNGSLFLQAEPGLLDTINKRNPEIWSLYKIMKKLDWDENEFDYSPCIAEFQTCSRIEYEMMIKTLSWQWEADSVASHSIAPVVAPFVSSTELWSAWSAISTNEVLHGLTYSEIVRGSFTNPDEVLKSVLAETESFRRLSTIGRVMYNTKMVGAKLTLKLIDRNSPEARDAIMLFTVAMLLLERIQFMSSFAITFAFAETGRFLPIGKAVQKICNDELNVHVKLDKAILANEARTQLGRESFERIRPLVLQMYREVMTSELNWTDHLFKDGRQLPGCTAGLVKEWIYYGGTDVCNTLSISNEFKIITKNTLGYMDDWIDINNNQSSPQEEKTGNYLLGGFKDNSQNIIFDVDGL